MCPPCRQVATQLGEEIALEDGQKLQCYSTAA